MSPSTLSNTIRQVSFFREGHPVEQTAAEAFCERLHLDAPTASQAGVGVRVGLASGTWDLGPDRARTQDGPWMWARVTPDGDGELTASTPALLYALAKLVGSGLTPEPERIPEGLLLPASFAWHRAHYDYVLTQTARTARGFDPEGYLEHLAACGFTHVEVNALAAPVPHEPGLPGEFYSPFYTYCAGLNQFVDTPLTRGVYPAAYLQANLNRLKRLAALCRRYGLQAGLLCFEPRTLPEDFFRRYPTLRGARVDHPFRSHLPRYTLAQDHPLVRDHYRRLMQNLMHEVPDLAYLSVWSNDSGAGFEHTASLYVGRNGGPYMIREWRSHEAIAEAAGRGVLRFLRRLRAAAAEVRRDFEVVLRIEPFETEHDVIMAGMGEGLSIEGPSLLGRGYALPYRHPNYPEQEGVAGSIHHVAFEEGEAERLKACRRKGFEPVISYSAGPGFNMESLLGIPFPCLLHRKLTALRDGGFRRVSALGGLLHTARTPYWPHPEVIRAIQLDLPGSLDDLLHRLAEQWAGTGAAGTLVGLWKAVDEAVSFLPVVPLYSHFGFVWLRTWVRPFVPDIEAIPKAERRYYERFMVSTFNNPNINDLGRDVLFELITKASGRRMARQFDDNVLPRLEEAVKQTARLAEGEGRAVFVDLRDRLRALRCWALTQRNTCAWVAGVYGYLEVETEAEMAAYYDDVQEVVASERANAESLLTLWETSDTEFMLVSETGETGFLYGENFAELLRKKIRLMDAYGEHEPRIDRGIIWRLS